AKVQPSQEKQPKDKRKTAEKKTKASDRDGTTIKKSNNPESQSGLVKDFMERLDAISSKLSQLALDKLGRGLSSDNLSKDQAATAASSARQSVDSEHTLAPVYPIVESKEKEICKRLFAPVSSVPEPDKLSNRLLDKLEEPIPIHSAVYAKLEKEVSKELLESNFCIVEQVGNICPTLTPRVETALL
ncbi:hypothetical protein LPJ75_005658, partial [Coemansia sp. RSA 2598]